MTCLFRFAVLLSIIALPCLAVAAEPSGTVFVVNANSASISMIDLASRKEIRRLPAVREPHHLMLSPDGKTLLVGDTAANQMLLLDPVTGDQKLVMPMADPYQLGFSPDGKFLVVNGLARNQVDVYDPTSFNLVKRFEVSRMPSHLAFSPDSRFVYVSLQGTGMLAAFDLTTLSPVWTVPVCSTPAGVLWLRGRVLVACMGADYVASADPASGQVMDRIVTGKGAHNLFLSPDKKTLWVNNRAAGTTAALDAETMAIRRVYPIPGGPDDIDFDRDGKLWITRRFAGSVAVLDPASGGYETIAAGRSPHGILIHPGTAAP